MKSPILVLSLFVGLFPLVAAASPQIDSGKETDIKHILVLTGFEKTLSNQSTQFVELMRARLQSGLPDPDSARARQLVETLIRKLTPLLQSEAIADMVQFYDKSFTAEELKRLIQFYESPLGRKLIEASNKMAEGVVGASSQRRYEQLIKETFSEMEKDFPELKQIR